LVDQRGERFGVEVRARDADAAEFVGQCLAPARRREDGDAVVALREFARASKRMNKDSTVARSTDGTVVRGEMH
jgi:hypothetical protein